jgi:hypothetical protein
VGEGLAVGLLALGLDAITINEWLVCRAFDHVWRRWAPSARFPAVRTGPGSDIVQILRGSARRKGPHVAVWSAGDAVGWRAGVTYEQWVELATDFAAQLQENLREVRYRESREPRSA